MRLHAACDMDYQEKAEAVLRAGRKPIKVRIHDPWASPEEKLLPDPDEEEFDS
ncbi:MAG: hypothetical protein ABSD89_14330 [Halobacteriota archaeon]